MLNSIKAVLATKGASGLFRAVRRRIKAPRARSYESCIDLVRDKEGLEIGGPSGIFSRTGLLPLYPIARRVDNCTFAASTVWDTRAQDGGAFRYGGRELGRQVVAEGTDLSAFSDGAYDFILTSHMLEHTANPLGALEEWKRVLRDDGTIVLVVPHKDGTFDHRRDVTPLEHLIEDYRAATPEDDLTHLEEIVERHDISRDAGVRSRVELKQRALRNVENRCLHHHVFHSRLVVEMLDYLGLQIRSIEAQQPYHIIAVAQKVGSDAVADNRSFLRPEAEFMRASPFETDRRLAAQG